MLIEVMENIYGELANIFKDADVYLYQIDGTTSTRRFTSYDAITTYLEKHGFTF